MYIDSHVFVQTDSQKQTYTFQYNEQKIQIWT